MLSRAELGNSAYLSISLRITGSWENERENGTERGVGKSRGKDTTRDWPVNFLSSFFLLFLIRLKSKSCFWSLNLKLHLTKQVHGSFVGNSQCAGKTVVKSGRCATWCYFINVDFFFLRKQMSSVSFLAQTPTAIFICGIFTDITTLRVFIPFLSLITSDCVPRLSRLHMTDAVFKGQPSFEAKLARCSVLIKWLLQEIWCGYGF